MLLFTTAEAAADYREWYRAQDWAEQELKPELRKRLAELPVELVVVSHGEPVHDRAAATTSSSV